MEDRTAVKKEITKGFTLIELLVTIAIIVSLTAVIFPRLSQYRIQERLVDGSSQLQSDLRVVQNNAISGTRCPSSDSLALNWSLIFNNSQSYTIDAACTTVSTPLASLNLDSDVSIEKVEIFSSLTSCTFNPGDLAGIGVRFDNISGHITFLFLPGGSCTANASDVTRMVITIHLNSNTSAKTTVMVERGGAIYIAQPTPTPTP